MAFAVTIDGQRWLDHQDGVCGAVERSAGSPIVPSDQGQRLWARPAPARRAGRSTRRRYCRGRHGLRDRRGGRVRLVRHHRARAIRTARLVRGRRVVAPGEPAARRPHHPHRRVTRGTAGPRRRSGLGARGTRGSDIYAPLRLRRGRAAAHPRRPPTCAWRSHEARSSSRDWPCTCPSPSPPTRSSRAARRWALPGFARPCAGPGCGRARPRCGPGTTRPRAACGYRTSMTTSCLPSPTRFRTSRCVRASARACGWGERSALHAAGSVLAVHPVPVGTHVGYRQRTGPKDGTLVVVSGGTSHGIGLTAPTPAASVRQRVVTAGTGALDAAGRALSPFRWEGKQRWFAEPPHQHTSMVWLPKGCVIPAVGDRMPADVRFTTSRFDAVLGLA